MRNLGALGPAPCAHSSVPNAVPPTYKKNKKKQGLLRHVIELGDSHPSHGAHVPPLSLGEVGGPGWGRRVGVGGCDRGPGWTERARQTESGSARRDRKRERHLLLISMGKFPRSRRLGLSPPDRARRLLRGSPFGSGLPQASLARTQSSPSEPGSLRSHPSGTPPTLPSQITTHISSNWGFCFHILYSWSHIERKMWYSYKSGNWHERELMLSHDAEGLQIQSRSSCYHNAWGCCSVYFLLISTAHFHFFTARGVGESVGGLGSFNTSSFHYGSKLITTPSKPSPHSTPCRLLNAQTRPSLSLCWSYRCKCQTPAFNHLPGRSPRR